MSLGHVDAAVGEPGHHGQGELVVAADQGVGGELAGEQPLGDGGAVALAELGAHRLGRRSGRASSVGGDEALVALEEVGGGVGVTDEAQVGAAVLDEQVLGEQRGRPRRSRRRSPRCRPGRGRR